MANQFLNAQEYANVMLLLLKNQLVTGKLVDGRFEDKVTDENGLSISIKRPPRFIDKKSGLSTALATQDVITGSVNVAITEYSKVHISIGDIEYVQSYNELMKNQTMKSAASTLAHSVDGFLQDKTLGFHSWVGTPGTVIGTPAEFNPVHTRLMENGAPNESLGATVTFADGEQIRGSLIGGNIDKVNRTALERTRIPILSEIDLYATQQGPLLTTGSRTDGLVDGAAQNVNYRDVKTTMTQAFTIDNIGNAKTVAVGEVFTIDGVYAYDWRRQQALPYLQQFTVITGGTSAASATPDDQNLSLTISPPIIVAGSSDGVSTDANTAFATVSAAPADNADVVWYAPTASTGYKLRSAWHKQAIAVVSARLAMPFTGPASFARDPETGFAIRYWRGSDITTGAHVHRWDMIYGAVVTDPFLGARINGT